MSYLILMANSLFRLSWRRALCVNSETLQKKCWTSMLRKNVKEMFKSKTKATFDGVDNLKVKVRKL